MNFGLRPGRGSLEGGAHLRLFMRSRASPAAHAHARIARIRMRASPVAHAYAHHLRFMRTRAAHAHAHRRRFMCTRAAPITCGTCARARSLSLVHAHACGARARSSPAVHVHTCGAHHRRRMRTDGTRAFTLGRGVIAAYLARLANLRCSRSLRERGASANGGSAAYAYARGPAHGPCRRSTCAKSDGSQQLWICSICQYKEMNVLPCRGR